MVKWLNVYILSSCFIFQSKKLTSKQKFINEWNLGDCKWESHSIQNIVNLTNFPVQSIFSWFTKNPEGDNYAECARTWKNKSF